MNAKLGVVAGALCLVVFLGIYFITSISYRNSEVELRNTITAKQVDNQNEYDGLVKKISQSGQVTEAQVEAIKTTVVEYAKARGTSGGSLVNAVHEAVPNIDPSTFKNLQNIIVASRDGFVQRQKELLDLKRAHDNLLSKFPGSFFLSDKQPIDIDIVTSTRTKKAFDTGVDDDDSVFKKKQ